MIVSLRRTFPLFAVLALLVAPDAVGQPGPIDLGTLGGTLSVPSHINDRGQVVGMSTTADGHRHAFLWTQADGMIDLGTLGGLESAASAINEAGQVVGASNPPGVPQPGGNPDHAFLWTAADGMIDLGTLGGESSRAVAITDRGEVFGWSRTANNEIRAFAWTPADGMVDLGTLGGSSSDIEGVNNRGQALGNSLTAEGSRHTFLWSAATGMVDFSALVGGIRQESAGAINERGQVIGLRCPSDDCIPFSWTEAGGFSDIGTLGGRNSRVRGLNDAGHVVGTSETGQSVIVSPDVGRRNVWHATMWTATEGLVDLGTLGGWDSTAYSVNEHDQVVGSSVIAGARYTNEFHAFVWTPLEGMVDLGTSSGFLYSKAGVVNNNGQVIGISYLLDETRDSRATMWVVPVAPDIGDWTVCAAEGGVCTFAGTTLVRYGAAGSYVYRTLTDVAACTNGVFGDPIYGTVKQCAIKTPPPAEWTFCAPENGVCAFTGTSEVRYGANGSFFFKPLTGGTACSNDVFGDPIYGTVKHCAIKIAPAPTDWILCAPEGGVCTFTGTTEVRYGSNGSFVYQTSTDGTACNNELFGDPIFGTVKHCAIRTTPPITATVSIE
jgi:probable HAF family extracellular repeat protein